MTNSQFEFDYGIITYKHRFNLTRALTDYKEFTLDKCIRTGINHYYKNMKKDKLITELQIVYKDENNNLNCLKLDLEEWTVSIIHVGDMQCNL